MTKIVNLTPHTIHLINNENEVVASFEPSGIIARAAQTKTKVDDINLGDINVDVFASTFGEVENLPPMEDGTIYIVSTLTAQACKDRPDVYVTDNPVRDDQGRIIGCRSLGKI